MRENFGWFLLIGLVAGWLSGQLMRGRGFGLFGNLAIGILGALLGGRLADAMGVAVYGLAGALLMAVLGAVILLFLISLMKSA